MHLTAQSHARPCAMHRTHTRYLHPHTAPPCSSTISTTTSSVWTRPRAPPPAPVRSDTPRLRHKRKRHSYTTQRDISPHCACAHEEIQQLKAELAHALHLLRVAVADKTEAELRLNELAQSAHQREQFLHARLDACKQQLSRDLSTHTLDNDHRVQKRSSWGIVHALADPLRAACPPALVQTRLPCDGAEQRDGRRLFVR